MLEEYGDNEAEERAHEDDDDDDSWIRGKRVKKSEEPLDPAAVLNAIILGSDRTRFRSAAAAVAFVGQVFTAQHVPSERAVVAAIALLSSRRLVQSHARQVFEAVLASPLMDPEKRRDLCKRILYQSDPTRTLRPCLRPLKPAEQDLGGGIVIDIPGGGRIGLPPDEARWCKRYYVEDAVCRYSVMALVRLGEKPEDLVRKALMVKVTISEGRGHVMGAMDVIQAFPDEVGLSMARRALEQWKTAGVGAVKLRAYEIGAALFGVEFARPALADGDRRVRVCLGYGVVAGGVTGSLRRAIQLGRARML